MFVEVSSRDAAITLLVGGGGELGSLRLTPAALELGSGELAARIVNLNTLAHLRLQQAAGTGTRPTEQQIAAFLEVVGL